jgi:acetoin utilization deacetylase AcuC-like enzyme
VWHPERAARLEVVQDTLLVSGVDAFCQHYEAPLASREDLLRVHTAAYVEELFARGQSGGTVVFDPDTIMGPGTLEAALRAAGAACFAVELVMSGRHRRAFCSVRPPGHHARSAQALGFCFFNNIAIATRFAMARYELTRVAIVDFDIHHGNGTEETFRNDPRVLLCSTYEAGNYASQWAGPADDKHINIALPHGADGQALRRAFREGIIPALQRYAPELIMISAGFDGHLEDELSSACFREADFAWVTEQIGEVADRHAGGRIVSVLEGGYALSALGRSVVAHLRALAGEPIPI